MPAHALWSRQLRPRLRRNQIAYFLYGCLLRLQFELRASCSFLYWWFCGQRDYDGMPLPPPRLRYKVHGKLDETTFLTAGKQVFTDLESILTAHLPAIDYPARFLDFGCGCSRTLRHFLHSNFDWRYTGVDVDNDAMQWNQAALPHAANWQKIHDRPPLPFANDSFDIIVAVSVFTHLDREMQEQWLRELTRVLAPDGILIISIHGQNVWGQVPQWCQAVEHSGVYFVRSNMGVRNFSGTPAYYQTALHSKSYVLDFWTRGKLSLLEYRETGINNYQDAIVLQKQAYRRGDISCNS